MLQIVREFESRTEYRMLKGYAQCMSILLTELKSGVLVLPGVVLARLTKEQLNAIYEWTEQRQNQLILVPAWSETNIRSFINASVSIEIKETKGEYEKIPVPYQIRSPIKDIVFGQDGKVYGIHYRRNTGSGLITVVTLPLLDYNLIGYEEELKDLFHSLLQSKTVLVEMPVETNQELVFEDIHLHIMLLTGAGVDFEKGYLSKLRKYFDVASDEETIKAKYAQLLQHGFIHGQELANKAIEYINKNKMKAFVRAIRERELKENEWI